MSMSEQGLNPRPEREVVHLKRLSLCACGFPTLNESIPLGTQYIIFPHDTDNATMICGGCGTAIPLKMVKAFRDVGLPGYLPLALFQPPN